MNETSDYRKEFWKSPQHIALGLLTLGLGFLSADWLPLILGATGYSLGWVYLPDMAFFKNWVDRRAAANRRSGELAQVAEFVQRRENLLASLGPSRRQRYQSLAQVCLDIEQASNDPGMARRNPAAETDSDPRLRKLDELMWTLLRLLGIEEALDRFLETERGEDLPGLVSDSESEVKQLSDTLDALKARGPGPAMENKQRLLGSRLEMLEVLRKRQQRFDQAEANLALVVSEQERLAQQIKLIRADAVAAKNADNLTARIDATVEHLDQTNKWISEMDEFKDLVGDIPQTEMRVGFASRTPPVIEPVSPAPARVRSRQKERQ